MIVMKRSVVSLANYTTENIKTEETLLRKFILKYVND